MVLPFSQLYLQIQFKFNGVTCVGLNTAGPQTTRKSPTKARGSVALCINLCTHSWPMRFMRCVLLVFFFSPRCAFCRLLCLVGFVTPTHTHTHPTQVRKRRQRVHVFRSKVAQRRRNNRNEPSGTWRKTRQGTKHMENTNCRSASAAASATTSAATATANEARRHRSQSSSSVRLETAPEVDVKCNVCRVYRVLVEVRKIERDWLSWLRCLAVS